MKNAYFNTCFKYSLEKDKIWKVISNYLQKKFNISNKYRVLDAGAGYCFFINNINAKEKYALDIDKDVLNYANKDVIRIIGSVYNMPFKNNFFDIIFSSNLLEHLSNEKILPTLNEFHRILKKGGRVIILSPNFKYCFKTYFDDYTHKSILTDKSLKDMIQVSGFNIEKIIPKFLPFSTESKIPKISFLTKIYLISPFKPFAGQMLFVAKK